MTKLEIIKATRDFILAVAPSLDYDEQIFHYGTRIDELEKEYNDLLYIQESDTDIIKLAA